MPTPTGEEEAEDTDTDAEQERLRRNPSGATTEPASYGSQSQPNP